MVHEPVSGMKSIFEEDSLLHLERSCVLESFKILHFSDDSPSIFSPSQLNTSGVNLQKPGYAESEFRRIGLSTFLGHVLLSSSTKPWVIPEGKSLGDDMQGPVELTPWLTAEDLDRYVEAFEKSGLTGPINVYRAIERYNHYDEISCTYLVLTILCTFVENKEWSTIS